ncbi:MAG: hypothetical protein Q9204_005005, partial [Flavoplaca sp. TL-2023a]
MIPKARFPSRLSTKITQKVTTAKHRHQLPRSPPPLGLTEETTARVDPTTVVQQLFSALSACADLHPDHDSNSGFRIDDEGAPFPASEAVYTPIDGLPPPMLGSGGWITAENVGDFLDEEGNFRGGGEGLGEGAEMVKGREMDDDGVQEEVDNNGVQGHKGE